MRYHDNYRNRKWWRISINVQCLAPCIFCTSQWIGSTPAWWKIKESTTKHICWSETWLFSFLYGTRRKHLSSASGLKKCTALKYLYQVPIAACVSVPPAARHERGGTSTRCATRATRPPSPAGAGRGRAQYGPSMCRRRRVAIAAGRERAVPPPRRDRSPQPVLVENARRAAGVCAGGGASRARDEHLRDATAFPSRRWRRALAVRPMCVPPAVRRERQLIAYPTHSTLTSELRLKRFKPGLNCIDLFKNVSCELIYPSLLFRIMGLLMHLKLNRVTKFWTYNIAKVMHDLLPFSAQKAIRLVLPFA